MARKSRIATAYIQLKPSMEGFFKEAAKETQKSLPKTTEKASKKAGDVGGKTAGKSFAKGFGKFAKVGIASLGIGAMVAGSVAIGLGSKVIKGGISRALNIEDAQASLKGLGYTAQQIKGVTNSVLGAVNGTAFALDEGMKVASSALASGIPEGKELEKYVRLIGDTATITGGSIEEIGAIFNKAQSKGKVYTEELNQLAGRGLPIFELLQKEYGVTAVELSKMVSAGQVDAKTFRKVIEENIGGAALASGDTTRGAIANVTTAFSKLGAVAISGSLPYLKESLQGMIPVLGRISEKLGPIADQFWAAVGPGVVAGVDNLLVKLEELVNAQEGVDFNKLFSGADGSTGNQFKEISDYLVENSAMLFETFKGFIGVVPEITKFLGTLLPMLNQLFDFAATSLPYIIESIAALFNGVAPIIVGIFQGVGNYIADTINTIVEIFGKFENIVSGSGTFFEKFGESIKLIFEGIWNLTAAAVNGFMDIFNGLIKGINGLMTGIMRVSDLMQGKKAGSSKAWEIPVIDWKMPKLAKGANVMGPTVAMIGEGSRPETVTDLGETNRLILLANRLATGALSEGSGSGKSPIIINELSIVQRDGESTQELFKRFMEEADFNATAQNGGYNYGR